MSEVERKTETSPFTFGGLDDTVRSLAKPGLELTDSVSKVAEDVLEAAAKLSERLRENMLEADAIKRAREKGVAGVYRDTAHRFIDVAADVLAVVADGVRDWAEQEESEEDESPVREVKKGKT